MRRRSAGRARVGRDRPRRDRSRQPAGRPLSGHVRARPLSRRGRRSLRRVRARRRDVSAMRRRGSSLTGWCIRPTAASTWRSVRADESEASRAVARSAGCDRPLDRRGAGSRVSGRQEQDDPDRSRSRRARRRLGCAPAAAAHQSRDLLGLARICRRRERCAAQDACGSIRRSADLRLSRVLGDPERDAATSPRSRSTTGSPTPSRAGAIWSATTRGSATSASSWPASTIAT